MTHKRLCFKTIIEYCLKEEFKPLLIIENHLLLSNKEEYYLCNYYKANNLYNFDKPIKIDFNYAINYLNFILKERKC